jgi:hypothetical protein
VDGVVDGSLEGITDGATEGVLVRDGGNVGDCIIKGR